MTKLLTCMFAGPTIRTMAWLANHESPVFLTDLATGKVFAFGDLEGRTF